MLFSVDRLQKASQPSTHGATAGNWDCISLVQLHATLKIIIYPAMIIARVAKFFLYLVWYANNLVRLVQANKCVWCSQQ